MTTVKWVIYDSISKVQSQPIEKETLQLIIYKMKPSDYKRFFIWTNGWENWQSLDVFLNSEQKEFYKDKESAEKSKVRKTSKKEKTVTKSMTKIRIDSEFTKTSAHIHEKSFSGDNLTLSTIAPPVNISFKELSNNSANYTKRATRHELKIEILLVTPKGKTFRSFSKNISLTGSLLEDNVPFDYYGCVFDVIVINRYASSPQNSRVQLKAKTAGEGLTARIHFENTSPTLKAKLKNLLEEYLSKQNNEKAS